MALRAATSMLDILWVLYDRVLRVSPDTISDRSGGLSYLPEGHGPMVLVSGARREGFIGPGRLEEFDSFGSILGHYPDRDLVPGAEISTCPLARRLPPHGLHACIT